LSFVKLDGQETFQLEVKKPIEIINIQVGNQTSQNKTENIYDKVYKMILKEISS